jgi:hypothetical protein
MKEAICMSFDALPGSLLCIFFCERLSDLPCVKQALDGILALVCCFGNMR